MTTTYYIIHNRIGGTTLGAYAGATAEEAIDALARDAGYEDHADACATTGENPENLVAREVKLWEIVDLCTKGDPDTYLTDIPPTASDDTSGARYETRVTYHGLPIRVTWGFSQEEVDATKDGDEGDLPWDADHIIKIVDGTTDRQIPLPRY